MYTNTQLLALIGNGYLKSCSANDAPTAQSELASYPEIDERVLLFWARCCGAIRPTVRLRMVSYSSSSIAPIT